MILSIRALKQLERLRFYASSQTLKEKLFSSNFDCLSICTTLLKILLLKILSIENSPHFMQKLDTQVEVVENHKSHGITFFERLFPTKGKKKKEKKQAV